LAPTESTPPGSQSPFVATLVDVSGLFSVAQVVLRGTLL
jgi:hypothetical protein